MKLIALFLMLLATAGCAEIHEHVLGARVHSFTVKGVQYTHCSIMMDHSKPQLAHDSIEVCRAAIETLPERTK